MEFQTKIPIQKQPHHLIDYTSKLLLLGSCFAENIGKKLSHLKFQNAINPFGILFHPFSIENLIINAINLKYYKAEDVLQFNDIWHSFDAHSRLSQISRDELLKGLNLAITATHQFIKNATHISITLGTAWIYRHIESDKIVANCHKIPQKLFSKELLTVDAVRESLEAITTLIKDVNTKATILFTVSPIRHFKDGFVENNQSKAHLLAAVHEVVDLRHQIFYFPSYEIVMDELRDYRFYAEDMIHLNQMAINHVWNQFSKTWISSEAHITLKGVEAVQKALLHKPFHPNTKQHKKFLEDLKQKQVKLSQQFPHIIF